MLVEYGYVLEGKSIGMFQCEFEDFQTFLHEVPKYVDTIYVKFADGRRFIYANEFGWTNIAGSRYLKPSHFAEIFKE